MEKTYKLLNNTESMTIEKIKRLYDGFWVFIVKAKLTDTGGIIEGVPVVVGAVPFDGAKDGIYDKYKSDEYAERCGKSFRHKTGYISSLRIRREANV
ncbi:MAG: hypothetical protein LBC73_06025 [Oscillospiraceae bacterium]|jgi:hypothetical protein|nr:hypothetical protein [Oscillospiraceae bacterium]